MSSFVGAFEAKTHLSALLERVERGEEIVITRHGRPVARLVPPVSAGLGAEGLIEQLRLFRRVHPMGALSWRQLRDEGRGR
ncbi:type II toxin-antitoxin system Phd/YefM family antitoxin [Methylibium sp.]|uniref:type II toxin-antitoxin system Phd/YefM family antitoxin n=1 Tax=Methylibium sp. TaxID=2067992 RepID=UPI00182857F8|nr:type II toxin-antitoxin system prevent-host-death family antitoxin [Methylibium sp.]MBA3591549.1 type II toxin-antitoxin system Phd/YefM family antitoxin [Methylibium sp.]